MDNKTIAIKTIKALKENNRIKLEQLAVENVELVSKIIEMEDMLSLNIYNCGTVLRPEVITTLVVRENNKRLDLRNRKVKELNTMLNCWDKYIKAFELNIEDRKN